MAVFLFLHSAWIICILERGSVTPVIKINVMIYNLADMVCT